MQKIRNFAVSITLKLGLVILFLTCSVLYTIPGPQGIWEKRTDVFMSAGSDPTALSYVYDKVRKSLIENPILFFYGGVPIKTLSGPEGAALWPSGYEKLAAILLPLVTPLEQVSVVFALCLLTLNGLVFYIFARSMGWARWISLALSLAFAYTPYTRARAQVHPSLAAIFVFPLCLLALKILQNNPKQLRNLVIAMILFLICGLAPHYYIVFLVIGVPLWLAFYFSKPEVLTSWRISLRQLIIATLPVVSFLMFSMTHAVPSDFASRIANPFPKTGEADSWPHPYLSMFAASPIDYLTGDVALGKAKDWNPIRKYLNQEFLASHTGGNYHENSLGIRWSILLLIFSGISYVVFYRKKLNWSRQDKILLFAFIGFSIFSFLASLPPDWYFMWGPSAWIHFLVPPIRTPNRIGILVNFCFIILVGLLVTQLFRNFYQSRKRKMAAGLIFLCVVFDYPPFLNPMPMTRILPSLKSKLEANDQKCGIGFHFPHLSVIYDELPYYYFLQRLRDTDCVIINPQDRMDRDLLMIQRFGYKSQPAMRRLDEIDPTFISELVNFANCNQLNWVIFDFKTPAQFSRTFCEKWDGIWSEPSLCRSRRPIVAAIPLGLPDQCLNSF